MNKQKFKRILLQLFIGAAVAQVGMDLGILPKKNFSYDSPVTQTIVEPDCTIPPTTIFNPCVKLDTSTIDDLR